MFDRIRIKEMAKTALKRSYWVAVLVAVLVGLLGGNLAGGLTAGDGVNVNLNASDNAAMNIHTDTDSPDAGIWDPAVPENPWMDGGDNVWDRYEESYTEEDFSVADLWEDIQIGLQELGDELGVTLTFLLGLVAVLAILAIVCGTLFTVFVGNVMTVSGHGWMLRHWRSEDVGVGEAFAGFRIYKPSVVTMLVRSIYVWLWSLLFIIPGIVKGYAYSMTPYIIYENPNLSADRAIKMSKIMTDGYKGDLFVLNLSFIGWKFLSGITGGLVGIFWSNPYMGLTHAGAYEDLKWKAIQSGKLTWEDFGQVPPPRWTPLRITGATPYPRGAIPLLSSLGATPRPNSLGVPPLPSNPLGGSRQLPRRSNPPRGTIPRICGGEVRYEPATARICHPLCGGETESDLPFQRSASGGGGYRRRPGGTEGGGKSHGVLRRLPSMVC